MEGHVVPEDRSIMSVRNDYGEKFGQTGRDHSGRGHRIMTPEASVPGLYEAMCGLEKSVDTVRKRWELWSLPSGNRHYSLSGSICVFLVRFSIILVLFCPTFTTHLMGYHSFGSVGARNK